LTNRRRTRRAAGAAASHLSAAAGRNSVRHHRRLLPSFGTLGVGYFARPLGAALFGHFGDRFWP